MADDILNFTDGNFDDAFSEAFEKLGGEGKEFMWKGKKFTTDLAKNPQINPINLPTRKLTSIPTDSSVSSIVGGNELSPLKDVAMPKTAKTFGATNVGQYVSNVGQNVKANLGNTTKIFKKGAFKALDTTQQAGALNTASIIANVIPTDDGKAETYTAAEIGKDVANLAISAAQLANPLTFVQGVVGLGSTTYGAVKSIINRKDARDNIAEERQQRIDTQTEAFRDKIKAIQFGSAAQRMDDELAQEKFARETTYSGEKTMAYGGAVNPFSNQNNSDFNTDFLNLEQNIETQFAKGGQMYDYSSGGMTPGEYNHETNDIKAYDKGGNFTGISVTGGEGVIDAPAMKKIYSFKKGGNAKKAGELMFSEMESWKKHGTAKQGANIPKRMPSVMNNAYANDRHVLDMLNNIGNKLKA
tara:strand:- start:5794 stop:7035 length:1242 start_codon:yes stop_codon:yes gene_type:complete